jgi:hypothetical protein
MHLRRRGKRTHSPDCPSRRPQTSNACGEADLVRIFAHDFGQRNPRPLPSCCSFVGSLVLHDFRKPTLRRAIGPAAGGLIRPNGCTRSGDPGRCRSEYRPCGVPGIIDLLPEICCRAHPIRLARISSYDVTQPGSYCRVADNGVNVLSADCAWKWSCPFHPGFCSPFQWGWTRTGGGYVLNLCCRHSPPQRISEPPYPPCYPQRKTSCLMRR